MFGTHSRRIRILVALVVVVATLAPAALADPPQGHPRAPEAVKEHPLLGRGFEAVVSSTGPIRVGGPAGRFPQYRVDARHQALIERHSPGGAHPQLQVRAKDDTLLARGHYVTQPSVRPIRADGPGGYQPKLRTPAVVASPPSGGGFDWVAAGSALGVGFALALLAVATWAAARRRPAHS